MDTTPRIDSVRLEGQVDRVAAELLGYEITDLEGSNWISLSNPRKAMAARDRVNLLAEAIRMIGTLKVAKSLIATPVENQKPGFDKKATDLAKQIAMDHDGRIKDLNLADTILTLNAFAIAIELRKLVKPDAEKVRARKAKEKRKEKRAVKIQQPAKTQP